VRIGSLGQYLACSFFTLGTILLLQYGEIIINNTNKHFFDLYTLGIPAINIATTLVCLGLALVTIIQLKFGKKGIQGMGRWNI
jgi:hypothetical protein